MSKIIMSPVNPRDSNITEEEKKQLYFLLIDSYNEEMPCIICGRNTDDNRNVYVPEEEFRHIYGLDLLDMKSIIYAICDRCKQFVNEIQIREKLKLAQREGDIIEC